MGESSLYLLSQRLRLLARANVTVDQRGDRLAGEIRQVFSRAHQRVSSLLDLVVDGDQLRPEDIAWIVRMQSRVQALRPAVRKLEQQAG